MTLRQYLTIMIVSSVLCWVAWAIVIINIDPFQSGLFGFFFFYITTFFSLLGSLSIIAFLIYRFFSRDALAMFHYVKKSFHYACLISLLAIILLFLQGNRLLNWWNFGAFALLVVLVASFLFSTKNSHAKIIISKEPPFNL